MKQVARAIFLAALVAGMSVAGHAQFRQSIYLNGVIPTGQFAKSVDSKVVPLGLANIGKDAKIGFGAGYRASYRFDVGVGEVAPFAQGDFFWNTIDGDLRDEYENMHGSTPTYFNVPVLVGVSYLYDELWNDITLFGEFGVGADILLITGESAKIAGTEYKFAYKPSTSFGWMIGAGAYFGRHFSAGLYYYGLGKHFLDYTKKYANEQALYEAGAGGRASRTVGGLSLRLGFHF